MQSIILGSGMTGLAAGWASGLPVYEAKGIPGGICSSYYVRPNNRERLHIAPNDSEAYRFEIGGGHWIFGGNPSILRLIRNLSPVKTYARKSSVFFPEKQLFVPYPLQNHLRFLEAKTVSLALKEMVDGAYSKQSVNTMAEWLDKSFGVTLGKLFFHPFHELYTAGLWRTIAPQDAYKSPVDLLLALQGAFEQASAVGYNVNFVYPEDGLDALSRRLSEQCDVRYGKKAVKIDIADKVVYFDDGTEVVYNQLISTLPLNQMLQLADLETDEESAPATSVLVINIGAVKGDKCPNDHWLYIPQSKAGFHRVGFYSNVDNSFLPASSRQNNDRVSIYVEKAAPENAKPDQKQLKAQSQQIVVELQTWDWIKEAEVVDPTWIETAYTWRYPNSNWKDKAMGVLDEHDIIQVGRYARWSFQGIADSIRDGLFVGGTMKFSK
ncbi:MAG: FAD-dependent oxidoreductase [Anaerolineae bacterium]|nr:FAD-dependent oxidoreductase [Anaerolineae bacterium]